ncbi:conjugal transfer protein TraR [Citrobacter freundii]|nr:conjugal transfer protein TraR [Citrobacter freundii]
MTDELDRISDRDLNERQRVVKAHLNRPVERAARDGYCNDCGNDIPAPRRQARPDAVTCLTCQQLREERRKRDH